LKLGTSCSTSTSAFENELTNLHDGISKGGIEAGDITAPCAYKRYAKFLEADVADADSTIAGL